MYPLPHTKNRGCVWPIMGAGDSRSQACSSCASYHWAYRDKRVTLVMVWWKPAGCRPPLIKMHIHVQIEIHNGEREEWTVGEQLAAVKAMTGMLHPWSPHLSTNL